MLCSANSHRTVLQCLVCLALQNQFVLPHVTEQKWMNKINFFTSLCDCLVGFFFSEEVGVDGKGLSFFFSGFLLLFFLSFVRERRMVCGGDGF